MRGFVVPPGIEWRGKARHRECNLATRKTKGFKENKKTFQKGRSNFQVVSTDQISNTIIEELQALANLKRYLSDC